MFLLDLWLPVKHLIAEHMLVCKWVFTVLLAYLIYLNIETVADGRLLATNVSSLGHYGRSALGSKKQKARRVFWFTLVVVVLVELMAQASSARLYSWLFWVHLPFALCALGSLGFMYVWMTGVRNRRLHRICVQVYLISMAVVVPTGLVLVWNL